MVVLDNLERQVHLSGMPIYKNRKAKYITGDIRHGNAWIKSLTGVDRIIHLACAVGVSQSFWQSKKYLDVNASGTALLFQTLIKNPDIKGNIKKIIVASSKSIYGEGVYRCERHGELFPDARSIEQLNRHEWDIKCPICGQKTSAIGIKETKPPQNLNPYALSKYVTERLAVEYSYALDIPTVALRYFNVYGPRQSLSNPYTGVLAIFLSRLKNGNKPVIFEDGRQMRDFVFVEDVAKINCLAMEKGEGVYNVGNGKPSSLIEVVKTMEELIGTSIGVDVSNNFRVGDNRHDFADTSRLFRDFGTQNFIKLDDGLGKLIDWAKKSPSIDLFQKEERERKRHLII